jgi:hypothetical protein
METHMKLDYATYLANPELRSSIHAEARRQRALAIHRLIFVPIAAFFRRPQKVDLRVAACR